MRWIASLAFPFIASIATAADDPELIAKQKMAAAANLMKCDVAKAVVIDTDNLFVTGDLPEEKLKTLSSYVQKQYAATLKGLKFEMTENPPKGKLAVYFFPERKKFALFVSELLSERIEKDERSAMDARGAMPYVAVSVIAGEKPIDLDVEAAKQIAVALLVCKAGPAMLPIWMKDGFARAMMWRLEPASASKERAQIRKMLAAMKDEPGKKGKVPVYKSADIWTGSLDAEKKLLGASLMEYFVFGPDSLRFSKILTSLRPTDEVPMPTLATALQAMDIKPEDLDKAWRKWVATGK